MASPKSEKELSRFRKDTAILSLAWRSCLSVSEMLLITLIFASFAYGQSELGTSAIRIMPRAADSDTGSVRFLERYSNGSNRIDLRAPAAIHADRILRLPAEDSTLVARTNRVFGSDSFTLLAEKATGTEASPADVSSGNVLFQFTGMARTGGSMLNAGGLTFSVASTGPLEVGAALGITKLGTYDANAFTFSGAAFYSTLRPTLGLSAAGGRWGTLYGDSADFLVPTGTTPQYETGSFVRTQTLELYDVTGLAGGYGLSSVNDVSNSYLRLVGPDGTTDLLRAYTKIGGASTKQLRTYATILPDATNTYNLGSDALRFNQAWGTQVNAGTLRIAGNSTFWTTINGGGSMSADVSWTLPSANAAGVLTNNGSGALSWAAGSSSGGYPLDEVKITDYGADDTCATAITAGSPSPWSQAYDVAKIKGAIVTFPPGCWGIDASMVAGNGDSVNYSTEAAIIFAGAGSGYHPGSSPTPPPTTTEIRWIGSAPGSPTPMIKFAGPYQGGGVKSIRLNANGVANVMYVEQIHQSYGTFEDIWATSSPANPSWVITTIRNGHPNGACYNHYENFHITNLNVVGGGGMYFTGRSPWTSAMISRTAMVSGSDACSNTMVNGEIWYDANTVGRYGMKFDFADNNRFFGVNLFALTTGNNVSTNTGTDRFTLSPSNGNIIDGQRVTFRTSCSPGPGCFLPTGIAWQAPYFVRNKSGDTFQVSTTAGGSIVDITVGDSGHTQVHLVNPGVLFEQYGPDTSFPKEQVFYASAMHQGVWATGGISGTGVNVFRDFALDDCFVSPCVPSDLNHILGEGKGQMFGTGTTPPGVSFAHSDAGNTFLIHQTSNLNGAGSILFQRQGQNIARLRAHYFDGLVFSTAQSGVMADRWKIADIGDLLPLADGTYEIGGAAARAKRLWVQEIRVISPSSFSTQNNFLSADASVNLYMDAYGGSGSDNRAFLHFRRHRGTSAIPAAVGADDRLGGMAFWGNVPSFGLAVGARINVIADGVSPGVMNTSIRIATQNGSGALDDRWAFTGDGSLIPWANNTYSLGSSSNKIANGHFQNLTVTGTCTGCGSGSFVTLDTAQTVTGDKVFEGVNRHDWIYIQDGVTPSSTRAILFGDGLEIFNAAGGSTGTWSSATATLSTQIVNSTNAFSHQGVAGLTATYLCITPPNLRLNIQGLTVRGGIITSLNAVCGP